MLENLLFKLSLEQDIKVEQVRAVFTTLCIAKDYEADTLQTDTILNDLWKYYGFNVYFENKDDFENYMYAYII